MYGQVPDFAEAEEWYKQHFGLLTSDQINHQDDPSKTGLGAFMRCDRGDEYADHHTLFLMGAGNPPPSYNHVAYEVANTDDVFAGHDHLANTAAEHGGTPQWGIGRHILGSQVYDYWHDPYGRVLEHWT